MSLLSDVTANKRCAVVAKLNTAYTCVANVYGRHCAETVCGFSTTGSTAITVNGSTILEAHLWGSNLFTASAESMSSEVAAKNRVT